MISTQSTADVMDVLYELSTAIVGGATIEQALDLIYDSFHHLLPYDRIGYADVDPDGKRATARWARSNTRVLLRVGYSEALTTSSLGIAIEHRKPRVLNDLPKYLQSRPGSRSTALIVREGIRASMTCPLFIHDQPTGLLFFSSQTTGVYTPSHVKIMKNIAAHLAMLLMTAQRVVVSVPEVARPAEEVDVFGPRDLSLSQLRPGMTVLDPIRLPSGALLLAGGTLITEQMIDRLIAMNGKGLVQITKIRTTY